MQHFKSGYVLAGNEEDPGLFTGNAGIGYAYLLLRKNNPPPDILAPWVNQLSRENLSPNLSVHEVIDALIARAVPNSHSLIKKLALTAITDRLNDDDIPISTSKIVNLFREPGLDTDPIIAADLDELEFKNNISSFSLLHIKKIAIKNKNIEFIRSTNDS